MRKGRPAVGLIPVPSVAQRRALRLKNSTPPSSNLTRVDLRLVGQSGGAARRLGGSAARRFCSSTARRPGGSAATCMYTYTRKPCIYFTQALLRLPHAHTTTLATCHH